MPSLRLEYVCSAAEISQAKSLALRKQLGGGSKWRTNLVLFTALVGMLLGGWFRFREIPSRNRAILLVAIVAGSVLFVVAKQKLSKAEPRKTQVDVSETDFTILDGGSKIVVPWSAFGECLESPELFVLTDRPKQLLVIVPKRVFPSDDWQAWFRELAVNAGSLPAPLPSEPGSSSPALPGRVMLTVHPRYLDCLASTLATWRTLGMCLFVVAIMLGAFVYSTVNPPRKAVHSAAEVFVMMVPFMLFFPVVLIAVVSILSWRRQVAQVGSQEISLSDESVAVSGAQGSATLPWTAFAYFKETPWALIAWRGSLSVILPKHCFASLNDLIWCRDLLERRLKRSRWFLG